MQSRAAILGVAVAIGVFFVVLKKLAMPYDLPFGYALLAAAAFGALLGLAISLAARWRRGRNALAE